MLIEQKTLTYIIKAFRIIKNCYKFRCFLYHMHIFTQNSSKTSINQKNQKFEHDLNL